MTIRKLTVKVNGGGMYLISFYNEKEKDDFFANLRNAMERYLYGDKLQRAYEVYNKLYDRVSVDVSAYLPDAIEVKTVFYSGEASVLFETLFAIANGCGEEIGYTEN